MCRQRSAGSDSRPLKTSGTSRPTSPPPKELFLFAMPGLLLGGPLLSLVAGRLRRGRGARAEIHQGHPQAGEGPLFYFTLFPRCSVDQVMLYHSSPISARQDEGNSIF